VSVVCCQVEVSASGLIIRPEESYRVWCVFVCDREASTMRRPVHWGLSSLGGGGRENSTSAGLLPTGWAGCPRRSSLSPGRGRRIVSSLKFKKDAEAEVHITSYSLGERALIRKGQSNRSFKLTTHLYLMLRFRISGVTPLLPNMCSWLAKGRLSSLSSS
jgi:hypothetical protein